MLKKAAKIDNSPINETQVYTFQGLSISREDFESLPEPICTENITDEGMTKVAKDIFLQLSINYGWGEKKCSELSLGKGAQNELEKFSENFWEVAESTILENGGYYYY